jgi:hypothetical protein
MSKKNWVAIAELDVNITDSFGVDIHIPVKVELAVRLTPEGELQLTYAVAEKMDPSVDYYDGVYIWLDRTEIKSATDNE